MGAVALVRPAPGPLRGSLAMPGDKSIAHRAVMLSSVARGTSTLSGLPAGRDVASTVSAMRACGAEIAEIGEGSLRIRGRAMQLARPLATIDCENSGTTMRLLSGLLAGQDFDAVLDGDASLRRRPMLRVVEPLRAMNASVVASEGHAPLTVRPASMTAVSHRLEVASAQVKSALLLAALQARGRTCVEEPAPSRDHTELMLAAMGVKLDRQGSQVCLTGPAVPEAIDVTVPGDPSSAAFFAVAAALVPASELRLRGLCLNPTRTGFVAVLSRMGARIELEPSGESGGEVIGDLVAAHASLAPFEIDGREVPLTIDELPVLAVAAARAAGRSRIRGAAELRVKESDRIRAVARMLEALGAGVRERHDGLDIEGCERFAGNVRVKTYGDHRIVMAAAVAALAADGPVEIEEPESADVSFPGFFEALAGLSG